jgi:thiamine biosynthesis lipoprotein
MGTMFDVMVYHASSGDAERAVEKAMAEIARLDEVMSHFEADSDLSRLVREARKGFARAGPDLYAVVEESIRLSRLSGGKFDVTIGPLLKASRKAREENRKPSAKELSEARRCVGSEKVELAAPDRVRFHSECLEIDLGGIGKGYAVDRAMQVLASAGVRHVMINAGSSSIASVGSPPDREGWPVKLGPEGAGSPTLLLQNASVSTSQQDGNILDPFTGAPTNLDSTVSVIAPTATASDALSTTLVMLSTDEAKKLLAEFADVSAFWLSPAGTLRASFRESRVRLSDSR